MPTCGKCDEPLEHDPERPYRKMHPGCRADAPGKRVRPPKPPRVCTTCSERPAKNKRGPAVCEECLAHRVTKERRCGDCDGPFRTQNNSTRCAPCTYKRRKEYTQHSCAKCDTLIDHRAKHCGNCTTRGPKRFPVGTRKVDTDGYVRVKTVHGWRSEHVHVMQEHLGRLLQRGETVHHRNGVRGDNRVENLELWAKSQPSGQRVADLLAWAHEIIERYGDAPV